MKRGRDEREMRRLLGPAAAAMKRNHYTVFRDAREATEQVSASKLLQDAAAMQKFHTPSGKAGQARLLIYSPEELAMYRQKTRAEMETRVKRGYKFLGNWVKFARWEAQQKDFARMRDVLQRAVKFHGDDPILWREYAEMEAANGFVQEARAVWSRGVTSLPAATDLWLKYLVFEQAAASGGGNAGGASSSSMTSAVSGSVAAGAAAGTSAHGQATENTVRDVFNRWLAVPTSAPPMAYELYALFEAQQGNKAGCRDVIRRYVERHNSPETWLFAGHTELNVFGDTERAVKVLQTALAALPDELLWGPVECRVPLALADVLTSAGRIAEARQQYQTLLSQVSGGGGGEKGELLMIAVAPTAAATGEAATSPSPAAKTATGHAVAASMALVDDVLSAYSRFERLHADAESGARLSRLEAQKAYERRVAADPADFDAWLSLYLVLREAARTSGADCVERLSSTEEGKESAAHRGGGDGSRQSKLHEQALLCLSRALATPARQLAQNPYAAQQRAVLVTEYAKRCEEEGQLARARQALEEGIRTFPFAQASCPRLWLEAAAFEERQGDFETARTLLSAGARKSREDCIRMPEEEAGGATGSPAGGGSQHSRLLFAAALRLEEHAMQQGLCTREAYLDRVRASYQEAIRTAPLDEKLWFGFAKLEEREGQLARAQALYAACIRTFTAEACKTRSFAQRYTLLGVVDKTWAKRLSLQQKLVKKAKTKSKIQQPAGEGEESEVAVAERELRDLYVGLLKGVWSDYTHEALAWRSSFLANQAARAQQQQAARAADAAGGAGEDDEVGILGELTAAVPSALPDALAPARARWADAVAALVDFIVGPAKPLLPSNRNSEGTGEGEAGQKHAANVLAVRAIFARMLEEERGVVKRALGWDADTSFDAAEGLSQWVELLLSPLTKDWAAFEATHGRSVAALQQHTAAATAATPQTRRTRLLRNRK